MQGLKLNHFSKMGPRCLFHPSIISVIITQFKCTSVFLDRQYQWWCSPSAAMGSNIWDWALHYMRTRSNYHLQNGTFKSQITFIQCNRCKYSDCIHIKWDPWTMLYLRISRMYMCDFIVNKLLVAKKRGLSKSSGISKQKVPRRHILIYFMWWSHLYKIAI